MSSSAARSHSMGFQFRSSAAAPGSRLLLPGAPSWRISPSPPDGKASHAIMDFSDVGLLFSIAKYNKERKENHTNNIFTPLLFYSQFVQA